MFFISQYIQYYTNQDCGYAEETFEGYFLYSRRKNDLLYVARTIKPDNLFLNEYLTRGRSNLAHKLRQLKRNNSNIKTVFTRDSNVICKVEGRHEYEIINSEKDFITFHRVCNSLLCT